MLSQIMFRMAEGLHWASSVLCTDRPDAREDSLREGPVAASSLHIPYAFDQPANIAGLIGDQPAGLQELIDDCRIAFSAEIDALKNYQLVSRRIVAGAE